MTLAEFLALVRESVESLEGKASHVRSAWYSKDVPPAILDVFDDYLIVQTEDGGIAKVSWSQDKDGAVTFGKPIPVELEFKPVRESADLVKPLDVTGSKWEARILRFGESKNGWVWTRESGEALLPHLEGVPVCMYPGGAHASESTIMLHGGPAPDRIVGKITAPRIESDGVYGEVHISEARADLRKSLLLTHKSGAPVAAGLSVDTVCSAAVVRVKGAIKRLISGVKRCFSVDIVNRPSAEGGLLRATAGPVLTTQEDNMLRDQLIALIVKHRPKLLEGRVVESITDEQLQAWVSEALEGKPPVEEKVDPKRVAEALDERVAAIVRESEKKVQDAIDLRDKIADTQGRVAEAVAATKLPDILKAQVRAAFKGKAATDEEIKARVEEAIAVAAALDKSGEVRGYGEAGRVLMESKDKVQVAMDRLFEVDVVKIEEGIKRAPMSESSRDRMRANLNAGGPVGGGDWEGHTQPLAKVREAMTADPGLRFRSIREAYVALTGDAEITGRFHTGRVSEALDSTSWAEITANTLYRRLQMDYLEAEYNENSIAMYGSAQDFRTKYVTQLGYFGDIAVVDPESADYAEITAVSDDQVSYAISQRGNILTITRKLIINDDLRAISRLVGRLGRAARRTLAKRIWQDNWVSNIAYQIDGLAWFHSTHGNTGSVALSADAAGAAEVLAKVTQLGDMTEPGSLEKLGMPPLGSLWLDVPHALMGVARRLNMTSYFGTTETNPVQGFFGANGERINVNPLFTDATDWGVHMAPGTGGREGIGVDFLQGRQEPEFFLADQPTVGQMFYGDKIQYKLRHEYATYLPEYRSATKNVVAG